MGSARIEPRKLALLLSLYFCQGLPFGFQATALPIYLREHGVSLAAIGFLQLLSLPWLLKAFWAPLVDRFGSVRLGRRKSWILPMQAGMGLSAAAGATLTVDTQLGALLAVVFLMNLFAATQDIAVDGLAVDLLRGNQLGPGNAAQVTGYKLGMITSGGLLVWVAGELGWRWLFLGMAGLCAAVFLFTLLQPEPSGAHRQREAVSVRQILGRLLAAARIPGGLWLLVVVGTYKAGESLVDVMLKPFLVDMGFEASQLGLWRGTYGMVASLLGSVGGGLLVLRAGLFRALAITAVLRAFSVGAEWWLTWAPPPSSLAVILVSLAEPALGGALTTALFAFMMSRVDPRIGATHYTVLASVEVMGKALMAFFSGLLAQRMGYGPLFALGTALSFAFLLLLLPLRSRLVQAPPPPDQH